MLICFCLFKHQAVDYETSLWNNSRELSAIVKYGFIREIKAGKVQSQKFDMMVFYANEGTMKKFPVRSYMFKGVAAAICHEGTSETTFSEADRHFSKTRTDVSSQSLCQGLMCKSGEKRRPTAAIDIQKAYKKLKKDRLAQKSAAASALAEES